MNTPAVLLLEDAETQRLVAQARRGRRGARRKLHRRLRAPLYPLAYAWAGHPWPATRAIRAAVAAGLADSTRPYGSAVVAALHRHTSRLRDGQDTAERSSALRRAVLVLCDGNRLSRSAAASLLGLPAVAVAEHHRAGRTALGVPVEDTDVPRCAGWTLVSRDESDLTVAERTAAQGHLRLCRRCRDGLAARRRTRAALQATGALGGGGAAAAAAVAIEGLLTSAGTATVAGGIGVVGGLGIVGGVNGGHLPGPPPFGSHASSPASATSPARPAPPAAHKTTPGSRTAAATPNPSRASRPTATASAKPSNSPASPPQPSEPGSTSLPRVPTVTLPGVSLPSLPGLPDLPLPSLSLPPVTLPTVALPGVSLPLPSVSLPKVSTNGLSPTSLTIPLPTITPADCALTRYRKVPLGKRIALASTRCP
jgi:hypothetical protein